MFAVTAEKTCLGIDTRELASRPGPSAAGFQAAGTNRKGLGQRNRLVGRIETQSALRARKIHYRAESSRLPKTAVA